MRHFLRSSSSLPANPIRGFLIVILLAIGWLNSPGGAYLIAQEDPKPESETSGEAAKPASEAEDPTGLKADLGIVFVSKTSSPKVYAPVKGAKTTVLAPAMIEKYGMRLVNKEAWSEKKLVWDKLYQTALKRADAIVDAFEPEFKRDGRGVIDYALVEDENPWLSTAVLSPKFLPRFEKEFGERLHVIVIDRNRIFIFPADGGDLASYAPAIADLYHDETVIRHPVSLEIFLIDEEGFQVVGEIEN